MNDLLAVIALKLIAVHGLDGQAILINPDMVTTLTARRASPNRLLVDRTNCLIGLVDGKFLSVVETCDAVRRMMLEEKR